MTRRNYIKTSILLLICTLVLSYQNCSVYKSDGLEEFEKDLLSLNTKNDCLPFMDVNIASNIMDAGGISVQATGGPASSQRALSCLFTSRVNANLPTGEVSCLITTSNRETSDVYLPASAVEEFYSSTPERALEIAMENIRGGAVAQTFRTFPDDTSSQLFYGFTYQNSSGSFIYSYISRSSNSTSSSNICAGNGCAVCKISLSSTFAGDISRIEEDVKDVLRNFVIHISTQNR